MKRRLISWLLFVPIMLGLVVLAGWIWLWQSESGAQWAWQQAQEAVASTPMGARLEGRLSGNLARGVRINSVEFRGGILTVKAERIELSAWMNLFPASVTVPRVQLHNVRFQVEQGDGEKDADGPDMPDRLSLPLPIVVGSLQVSGFDFQRGDVHIPLDSISASGRWYRRLRLDVDSVKSADVSGALELTAVLSQPYPIESEIRIERYALPAQAQSAAPWLPPTLQSDLSVQGALDRLEIEGEVRWPGWIETASLNVQVEDLIRDLRWLAEFEAPEAVLPADLTDPLMSGQDPSDPQRIVLRDLSARAEGGTSGFEFGGTSTVDSPWARNAPVTFEGAIDQEGLTSWSALGEAALAAEGWPAATIDFTAEGTTETLTAGVEAPSIFGGSLSMSAQAEFNEAKTWHTRVTARSIATAPLIEALSSGAEGESDDEISNIKEVLQTETVDAQLDASGQFDPMQFSAIIHQLEGQVRGRPVVARGTLAYGTDGLSASGLVFESGRSKLTLDGNLATANGVELAVDIATLDDLIPGASGTLTGSARYAHPGGDTTRPATLRTSLQGKDLQAFDWSLAELQISEPGTGGLVTNLPAAEGISSRSLFWLSIVARDIQGPAGSIPSAEAVLAGDTDRQSVALSADFGGTRLAAGLAGRRSGEDWTGKLEHLEVAPGDGPPWTLGTAAPVRWAGGLNVESACLAAGEASSMCLDIEQRKDGSQAGRATLASVSPDLFLFITDWPLSFSQRLDGTLDWTLAPGARPSARADIALTAGTVLNTSEGIELLTTQQGVLHFVIERGSLHSGDFDIPFESGEIDVDLSIPELMAGASSPLQGRVQIRLDDLDVVESFVPELVQTEGRLAVDVELGGTLAEPRLDGLVELRDGLMHVHAPGLRLSEIQLRGQLSPDNGIAIDGSFAAGEGRGELRGSVDLARPAEPTFDVHVTGQSLALIDVPDIRLKADTDVSANWDGEELQLSGRILVPWARIAPRYVPSEAVTESPDVVIVSGGETRPQPEEDDSGIRITGELEVALGEDVLVDLDLAKAKMSGDALFRWNGPPTPIADGQYDLRGEISAYGQNLEISRASIRFPNVPADNPRLDIRAERRIYGNSLVKEAGVLISGTAKRPLMAPYTVPPTNADRARVLLITGSDFDYEQGVGAVNVGTYIAPRLYLSYGVGVFEDGNVITARYDLKQNFGVKATSGQDDTGVDISYTIER